MMKFIFFLLFLIPLGLKNLFWLTCLMMSLMVGTLLFSTTLSFNNLGYWLGLDLLSFSLILLTLWIGMMMLLASEKIYFEKNFISFFLFNNIILMLFLVLTFCSLNLFIFYFFFESSLIPVMILILGWGYQPERLQAGSYLLFYTLLVSLPMMICIFYCYKTMNSLFFVFLQPSNSLILFFFMNMVFFIKFPMFFVHLWLPKAHVEAPISGSMILAGVMLKLGGYGMIRIMPMFLGVSMKFNCLLISISLVGAVLISLICLRQSDMKMLIAYSSVSHMGLVLAGILTLNYWGLSGSLVMMLAHGLCSSGLFCLANISYERTMSRSLYLNKGMINIMPNLSLWWFLLLSSNMAAPPSFNLLGEIMLINSLVAFSSLTMICLFLVSFFSAAYSLYLYSFSQHGKFYSGMYSYSGCTVREFMLVVFHWLPLNLLILKGEFFSLWI